MIGWKIVKSFENKQQNSIETHAMREQNVVIQFYAQLTSNDGHERREERVEKMY